MGYFQHLHGRIGALAGRRMFFIGGSPKSGTTWLQLLLDAHPAVCCKGESQMVNHLAKLLMQDLDKHNRLLMQKNSSVFAELPPVPLFTRDDLAYLIASALLLFLAKADPAGQAAAIGEKTPDNVRYFDVLHAIFPQARFIHLVRDGRDCAVSGWFHMKRTCPEWDGSQYGALDRYSAMFAAEWAKDLAEADAFARAHPGACLSVRYEDLVADPAPTLGGVFDFLDVAGDAATLATCAEQASFPRLSGGRAAGQEDRASFFRNGQPGDWRRHLNPTLAAAFRQAAGEWLERFGYRDG